MKQCLICKVPKPLDQFNWRNKAKGQKQGQCRDCKKVIQKSYYRRNSEQYRATSRRTRLVRQKKAAEWVIDYLRTHSCVDCNENDPRVLQFDHVRGEKFRDVCEMVSSGYALARVQEEVAKCDMRCASCHMRKTWPTRFGGYVVHGPVV